MKNLTRMAVKAACAGCLAALVLPAQATLVDKGWFIDFGTSAGNYRASGGESGSFIPAPGSGGGQPYFRVAPVDVAAGLGGAGHYLNETLVPSFGEGIRYYLRSPKGPVPHKFTVRDISGSDAFRIRFDIRFQSAGTDSSDFTFNIGRGGSFASSGLIAESDSAAAISWGVAAGQPVETQILSDGSWVSPPSGFPTLQLNTDYVLEVVVNASSEEQTFLVGDGTYDVVAPASWSLSINGNDIEELPVAGGLLDQDIVHFGFTGRDSASNQTWIYLDNISYYAGLETKGPDVAFWESENPYRLIVEVPPRDIDGREMDEAPASVEVDFEQLLADEGIAGLARLSRLQVKEIDEEGVPVPYEHNALGQDPSDRPLRWYDAEIPYDWQTVNGDIARNVTDENREATFSYVTRQRWGYFTEAVGDWKQGMVGWVHTQRATDPTRYAIYFDTLPEGSVPDGPEPRGWIGDGTHRTDAVGPTTTGQFQTRIFVDDFNDNGLMDFVAGNHRGQMLWWPNLGTPEEPVFKYPRIIWRADGKPLDVGMHGTPAIADWDGDGRKDLIISHIWEGYYSFFRNVGTNADRVFEWAGFIEADGEPITSPFTPVPEATTPTGDPIFHRDYFAIPHPVDWNGNGQLDMIAGSYVTGRVYLYENIGTEPDGRPILTFQGEIMADNEPLDVGWAAAPVPVDIRNNGRLDLIVGVWRRTAEGDELNPGEPFLRYFRNDGTRSEPVYTMQPMPRSGGDFPNLGLTGPQAVDWNGDGVYDLIVAADTNIYHVKNLGTAEEPDFSTSLEKIEVQWGSAPFTPATRFDDVNDDGIPDIVDGTNFNLGLGDGYPWNFGPRQSILQPGQVISHPVQAGDGWSFNHVADMTGNGKTDVLNADYYGYIWFHENTGEGTADDYDLDGIQIVDTNGDPVRFGPDFDPDDFDFQDMQGSRLNVVAADFDGDGHMDIATRDTRGWVYYLRRVPGSNPPVVETPVRIRTGVGYGYINALDWNGNGRMDVFIPSSTGNDQIMLNMGGTGSNLTWEQDSFVRPGIPVAGTVTSVSPIDINMDGDEDIIISNGHRFSALFERSFLEWGYAEGNLLGLEEVPRGVSPELVGVAASTLNLEMTIGQDAQLHVRATVPPEEPVTINASVAGDTSLRIDGDGELVFDLDNWRTPRPLPLTWNAGKSTGEPTIRFHNGEELVLEVGVTLTTAVNPDNWILR